MSFRFKTIVGIALIQAVLLVTIIWSAQSFMRQSHEKELRQRALTAAGLFATTSKDAVLSMDLASLKSFVEEVMRNPDFAYARVKNAGGEILAQQGPMALLQRPFREDRDFHSIRDSVFDTYATIEEAGIEYGRVEIGISTQTIAASLADARQKIAYIALVEIGLSIIFSYLLGAYLTKRLIALRMASERISAGDLGFQIPVDGKDEIGITQKTFNEMSFHLRQSMDEIREANQSLSAEIAKRKEAETGLQKAQENLEKSVEERTEELASVNEMLINEIQERRTAETKRWELEARLQRAEKMEALGTLAGGVAHDLNNVLSGIVSYPDILLMQMEQGNPLREPIKTIKASGQKAATIVQDLLTLSRRGVMSTEVLNLNDLISEYLESSEHAKLLYLHQAVAVETDPAKDLLYIKGSAIHITKAVTNIVANAVEAMPDGGRVLIRTENRYVDKPVRGYDAIVEGDYVVMLVQDHGATVSPKDRERIFEPFYTKKHMGRNGTGLELSVVWGIVKDHNGYIDLSDTEGGGSTFSLYFPCTEESWEVKKDSSLGPVRYQGNGEKVLVVDDVAEQLQIAELLLSELGYDVATVQSGENAVEYISKNEVDLVVLDMIMDPGMDGLNTYRAILEIRPAQKAVIASGYSETGRVREAQRLGAGEYIKKPYTIEKIGMAVRRALDS